jgi:hypothetical protein
LATGAAKLRRSALRSSKTSATVTEEVTAAASNSAVASSVIVHLRNQPFQIGDILFAQPMVLGKVCDQRRNSSPK